MASTFSRTTLRYNLGIYIRTDTPASYGGALNAAGVYGSCLQETLGGTAAGLVDMDGDGCGDLNKTAVEASSCVISQLAKVSCVDLDGDGLVNVPVCMTWSTGPTDCNTAGMLPSSASKCVCTSVNLPGVYVYGGPDAGKLVEPTDPLPPGAPPVVWPAAAQPPPPAMPPPSPPGVAFTCPAGGGAYDPATRAASQVVNGGFELPELLASALVPHALAPLGMAGWATDASDAQVDVVLGKASLPAAEGAQFAEACSSTACSTLYQDVQTTPGTRLAWSLQHRGRYGVDVANLTLGAPNATPDVSVKMMDDTTVWGAYSGFYTVPAGQTVTRIAIKPITAMGVYGYNNIAYGNLIDNVQLTSEYAVCCDASVNAFYGSSSRYDLSFLSLGPGLIVTGFPTLPDFGKVVINAGARSIQYTPSPGFIGDDTLQYSVIDATAQRARHR
jgi:hypothetical protein